ncbi:hypothetical protein E1180_08800 [Roseibium denhamense]|uniref:SAM dependent carboxyl methyltransferase n=1 Tax=Roseibium denhamense TaxID=76305 RepID=A0ABY1NAV9_9HYPH|nr:hypothetical protein [Roseibium denhamense]MTI05615.1 hypothetical protein [Roseibium denhamense]SMP03180.1 SAM dependent carboxyl methyltransferase [Roseibium denhamense]
MTADTSKPDTPVARSSTRGMIGQGFYNAHSRPQLEASLAVLPFLDRAIEDLRGQARSDTVTLADFGCSEGRNSILIMHHAIQKLQGGHTGAVHTVHSDLPTNDFTELLRGLRPNGVSVFGEANVYSSIVGGSMYDQLLPPDSVDLAMTFNAIAFFSKRPCPDLPGYILPNGPSRIRKNGIVTAEERAKFAKQADLDLTDFLLARADELRGGGHVLVQVFGVRDGAATTDGLYDLLNDAVCHFVETGYISADTYRRYYQPIYLRNEEELVSPVISGGNPASKLFELVESTSYEVAIDFVTEYQRSGDVQAYAKAYVAFFRAFTEAVLRAALPADGNREQLIKDIYKKAEHLLMIRPELYPPRYLAVAMLLKRKPKTS